MVNVRSIRGVYGLAKDKVGVKSPEIRREVYVHERGQRDSDPAPRQSNEFWFAYVNVSSKEEITLVWSIRLVIEVNVFGKDGVVVN